MHRINDIASSNLEFMPSNVQVGLCQFMTENSIDYQLCMMVSELDLVGERCVTSCESRNDVAS
jgi:hypothetical protein